MSFVSCVGLAVRDLAFHVETIPQGPGKSSASRVSESGGGPAATAAVAIARLGHRARFIGPIGDDTWGAALTADLREFGVDTSTAKVVEGASTSLSVVTVDVSGN